MTREKIKLADLKAGDIVEIAFYSPCTIYSIYNVNINKDGRLYFTCHDGEHYLDGQKDEDGYLIDVYKHVVPATSKVKDQ